jgi:hypothetical protein
VWLTLLLGDLTDDEERPHQRTKATQRPALTHATRSPTNTNSIGGVLPSSILLIRWESQHDAEAVPLFLARWKCRSVQALPNTSLHAVRKFLLTNTGAWRVRLYVVWATRFARGCCLAASELLGKRGRPDGPCYEECDDGFHVFSMAVGDEVTASAIVRLRRLFGLPLVIPAIILSRFAGSAHRSWTAVAFL